MSQIINGKIDLLKLASAGVFSIQGKNAKKKCIVIPIEDNDIYITKNLDNTPRSAYLSMSIFERREVGQYGDTHFCKQNFSDEYKKAHSEEEMKTKGDVFLGDFKSYEYKNESQVQTVIAPDVSPEEDDMPF